MGGNRITQVEMNGTMISLNDYYHNNQAKVTYNIFRAFPKIITNNLNNKA